MYFQILLSIWKSFCSTLPLREVDPFGELDLEFLLIRIINRYKIDVELESQGKLSWKNFN